jgi:hypothetical protein
VRAAAPWLTVALLGAFHGVNPAMGWLFAVGRGLHTGERRAVFEALPPIALGHFLSIAGVALLAGGAGFFLDVRVVRWTCAGLLFTFGILLLFRKIRHRWFGMQVGFGGLTGWSFLMASAHGAGLMVVPAVLSLPSVALVCQVGTPRVPVASAGVAAAGSAFGQGLAAVAVHTLSLLAVAALVAFVVYDRLGLKLLKRAWINLDALWAVALIAAAILVLLF